MSTKLGKLLLQGRELLAVSSASARLDAEILLGHVLKVNRAHLYANPESQLEDATAREFLELIRQRACGRPVAHLTGKREFWSLEMQVTPDVLVPRPETELLVERALDCIPADTALRILDLGCGSGAIGIAIATERPLCRITAVDRSAAALRVAASNADRHCPGRIELVDGSWFEPLKGKHFDVIVCNPPYVATNRPELTDRELEYEPAEALYSGADGLNDLRTIVAAAPAHLSRPGRLLLEHGFDQSADVSLLLQQAGFDSIETFNDTAGLARVTSGRMRN